MTHSGAVLGLTHVGAQWLIGIGVFVLCLATSIFLITAITTLRVLIEFFVRETSSSGSSNRGEACNDRHAIVGIRDA